MVEVWIDVGEPHQPRRHRCLSCGRIHASTANPRCGSRLPPISADVCSANDVITHCIDLGIHCAVICQSSGKQSWDGLRGS